MLFYSRKTNNYLEKLSIFHHVFDRFWLLFPFYALEQIAPLLFFKEQREQFVLIALYKRATGSDLLQSLFRSQKTSDSMEKPKSEIPNSAVHCTGPVDKILLFRNFLQNLLVQQKKCSCQCTFFLLIVMYSCCLDLLDYKVRWYTC